MIRKGGHELTDLEMWRTIGTPASEGHWKAGRSAMESARAWLESAPALPSEVSDLLSSHEDFDELREWEAEPEARVRIDAYAGNVPNVDVLLTGRDRHGPLVVAIEAKADEAFSATLEKTRNAADERLAANERSKGVTRLDDLEKMILGGAAEQPDGLRYQLLTATAASLIEARNRKATRAVLVVHEFVTDATTDRNHERNAADLDAFAQRVSGGAVPSVSPGILFGPITLPGAQIDGAPGIRFYLGKAVRNLRGRA